MEGSDCDICFTAFSEKIYVPKSLECGHTICLKCLETLLQGQKSCPTCMKTLSKSLEEYPTNFILLKILTSSKEKCCFDLQEMNYLRDKVNLLLSNIETYRNTVEESIFSLKNEMTQQLEKFEKLYREKSKLYEEDEKKMLMEEIDFLEKALKNLNCVCNRKDKNNLHLSQYKNGKHFLYDLVVRLQNDTKIYSCEDIVNVGWRYGEITFSEDRLYIHCLSSPKIENDAVVVSLHELRNCIVSKEDISPFIQIGDEKLIFTLTDNLTPQTIRVIKLCTGEGGETLKDLKVGVDKYYPDKKTEIILNSLNWNRCYINCPSSMKGSGYEDALFKKKSYKVNKDEIILLDLKTYICIIKVSEESHNKEFLNVVCKLQENRQTNFNAIINKSVEDTGISFLFK